MKKDLRGLIKIAKQIGKRPDFVQGAGGNLSVKLDNSLMLIKASGLRFNELSEEKGFIKVDYIKLRKRYTKRSAINEKEEADFLLNCSINKNEEKKSRPSMEAGFHAFLGKYVLHTHSAYVNVLTCAKDGKKILFGIFEHLGIDVVFLDYVNPGPELAIAIGRLMKRRAMPPKIIFLTNHGLIISGDSAGEVLDLHEEANKEIKKMLNLPKYPHIGIRVDEQGFKSKYLHDINKKMLKEIVLFPDQAVFCINNKKIETNEKSEIVYTTHKKEALAIEEIINAWNYILYSLARLNLSPITLNSSVVRYLTNMEAEKHRKKISK